MDFIALQTLLIGIVVGVSCALMGVFLVLRKMSMMIDAISHTVLLGIVLAFILVGDLSSPWLMIGATAMGVLTVVFIELLVSTQRISEDGATGTVFPLLFSIAVILITTRFRHTHLDTHAISGNLEFAAFEPLLIAGVYIGSKQLIISSLVLLLLVVIIMVFFKEFKITIFDFALAKTLGLMPTFIHYLMMTMVSLTAVSSFNAVGTILVVAMMIGPAASAILITTSLSKALKVAALLAAFNASFGYFVAMVPFAGQVNIAATISTVTFATFLLIWIFEPKRGLLTSVRRHQQQRRDISKIALYTHLLAHDRIQLTATDLTNELGWSDQQLDKVLQQEQRNGHLVVQQKHIKINKAGEDYYQQLLKEYT